MEFFIIYIFITASTISMLRTINKYERVYEYHSDNMFMRESNLHFTLAMVFLPVLNILGFLITLYRSLEILTKLLEVNSSFNKVIGKIFNYKNQNKNG